jgi:hypothetical protein
MKYDSQNRSLLKMMAKNVGRLAALPRKKWNLATYIPDEV